jgi:hypothetical protein
LKIVAEKPDDRPQANKFREMARELGCDEDPEAFKAKLQKVARAPKLERVPTGALSPAGRRRKSP